MELPPTFGTRNYAIAVAGFSPPAAYSGSTINFEGATFRGTLRSFGVINPINYFLLAQLIAEEWKSISAIYKVSTSSGAKPSFPKLSAPGRAIETTSISARRKNLRHLASMFPVIISLDINRFYSSIYTHSIPWAALGKEEAKKRHKNGTLSGHWSDKLDKLVRNCNRSQTVGIPIGPDTSRIISELILSRVDCELVESGTGLISRQISHNIDDYQIGCSSLGDCEQAQSRFVRVISRYELRINDYKTSLDHGLSFAPSNFQRNFDLLRLQRGERFVEHFFEVLYTQMQTHPNSNVAGYALKSYARKLAASRHRKLVREFLQRLIFAAPHQVRWIFPLLLGIYKVDGSVSELKRIIYWGIETCTRRNDVGSLLWFLYAAIFMRVHVSTSLSEKCLGLSSEITDLVLIHGHREGLFSIDVNRIQVRYLSSDFKSAAWLPLYEVGRRGWNTSPSFSKLGSGDDHYGLYEFLNANGVEFYLTGTKTFSLEAFEGWNLTDQSFYTEDDHLEEDFESYYTADFSDHWDTGSYN